MTPSEFRTNLQQFPEPLRQKLVTLPHGATVDSFTSDEQSELIAVFGPAWPMVLLG